MDRLVFGAALAICLALLVPLTYIFPGKMQTIGQNSLARQLLGNDAADGRVRLIIDCQPLGPNELQLVATCTSQNLPED